MNRLDTAYYAYMNVLNDVAKEMVEDDKSLDSLSWFSSVLEGHGLDYDELSDADIDYIQEQIQCYK